MYSYLHGHATTEHGCHCKVASVAWVTGRHHVLGIEHLLRQFGHCERAVLLGAARCQGCESGHEEVQTWEGHHIDSQFTQI